jgi:mRNA interferase HigB
MNIIARRTLTAFWTAHPETKASLTAWIRAADAFDWQSMNEIVQTFSKASPINAERCVFDIAGGDYRLIVSFKFKSDVCFIKFLGTHAEYNRVDAATVDLY